MRRTICGPPLSLSREPASQESSAHRRSSVEGLFRKTLIGPNLPVREDLPGLARVALPRGGEEWLIREEPLLLEVEGERILTMRTPGEDEALALGFLLGEGVIGSPDDVRSIAEREGARRAPRGRGRRGARRSRRSQESEGRGRSPRAGPRDPRFLRPLRARVGRRARRGHPGRSRPGSRASRSRRSLPWSRSSRRSSRASRADGRLPRGGDLLPRGRALGERRGRGTPQRSRQGDRPRGAPGVIFRKGSPCSRGEAASSSS